MASTILVYITLYYYNPVSIVCYLMCETRYRFIILPVPLVLSTNAFRTFGILLVLAVYYCTRLLKLNYRRTILGGKSSFDIRPQ